MKKFKIMFWSLGQYVFPHTSKMFWLFYERWHNLQLKPNDLLEMKVTSLYSAIFNVRQGRWK